MAVLYWRKGIGTMTADVDDLPTGCVDNSQDGDKVGEMRCAWGLMAKLTYFPSKYVGKGITLVFEESDAERRYVMVILHMGKDDEHGTSKSSAQGTVYHRKNNHK